MIRIEPKGRTWSHVERDLVSLTGQALMASQIDGHSSKGSAVAACAISALGEIYAEVDRLRERT